MVFSVFRKNQKTLFLWFLSVFSVFSIDTRTNYNSFITKNYLNCIIFIIIFNYIDILHNGRVGNV